MTTKDWIGLLIVLGAIFWLTVVFAEDLLGVQYVSNYDGDTLTVNLPGVPAVFGKHLPVRLRGLDTPERQGKCPEEIALAKHAAAVLRVLLQHATSVDLLAVSRDKYFRIGAVVLADGVNVNQRLLDLKLARPYDGGTRKGWCP